MLLQDCSSLSTWLFMIIRKASFLSGFTHGVPEMELYLMKAHLLISRFFDLPVGCQVDRGINYGVLKLACTPNLLAGEVFPKKITTNFSQNHHQCFKKSLQCQ